MTSDLHTDKNTAVHWFKKLKAFDQVVENKPYAQALSCNLNESKFKCRESCNLKARQLQETKRCFMLLIASLARHTNETQTTNEGLVSVKRYGNYKNYPKTMTGGGVTGVAEAMRPVQLTNRFQPLLLMNSADDVCSSQSRLTDQTKDILTGKKTKLGNWKGILKISATSLPHNSNLLGVACQKLPFFRNKVALISPCWLFSPKINWWEKLDLWKGTLHFNATLTVYARKTKAQPLILTICKPETQNLNIKR